MNFKKSINKAKVCAIIGALLSSSSLTYAETVVHTTRHYSDKLNVASDLSNETPLAEIKVKSRDNNANNKPKKTKRPQPYSWDDALDYAKMYPEDITPHKIGGYKDKYGNFSNWRCIDFLGDQGLMNRGNSFWGRPSRTYLRLAIHYGQETNPIRPFATIIWAADVNKRYQNDLNQNLNDTNINDTNIDKNTSHPKYIRIVFESGYEKEFSTDLDTMRGASYSIFNIYDILFPFSLFFSTVGDQRSGYIILTSEDIWDIYKHGNIANVYLDDNKGLGLGTGQLSFFYSGEKQEEHKRQLTYGIEHMVRLLNINPATVAYDRKQREDAEKKTRYDKVRSEAKEQVYMEEMKKEVLAEVREEIRESKELR